MGTGLGVLRFVDFFSGKQNRSRSCVQPIDESKKASIRRSRLVNESPSYEIAICDTTGFIQFEASGSLAGGISRITFGSLDGTVGLQVVPCCCGKRRRVEGRQSPGIHRSQFPNR